MNLRFDKNQIRVRIWQAETNLLLDDKVLRESFAFSDSADPIQLQIEASEADFKFEAHRSVLRLVVPRGTLLKALQTSERDPVGVLTAVIHGANREIIFEVDVFKKREGFQR